MNRTQLLIGCLVLCLAWGVENSVHGSGTCRFPAVYIFGDSNSDTGGAYAVFSAAQYPNGETFFGLLPGRFCDGRLILDFLTEALKLPYMNSYMNSFTWNYRHGANFAVGGARIFQYKDFISPFDLEIQIRQFKNFKSRAHDLYHHFGTKSPIKGGLPRPKDFSKALYIIDIGQNDLSHHLKNDSKEQFKSSIPTILKIFNNATQDLYNEGARVFSIHNTGPFGCLPDSVIRYKSKLSKLDTNRCVKPLNEMTQEFNRQLKGQVIKLRKKLPHAKITYVDMYAAKYKFISNSMKQGFLNPLIFCCGNVSYSAPRGDCGAQDHRCKNPSEYISWDGIHYTQAANLWVAKLILNGSFSDPSIPIGDSCL